MYGLIRESLSAVEAAPGQAGGRDQPSALGRNVVYLGLTSFFTDISSEMVSSVFPLYVLFFLRLSALDFGLLDGLYQGASGLLRVSGGLVSDRWQRHKETAAAGYSISAICKPALLVVGGLVPALAAVVLLDRTGKAVRTAPRDALISLSVGRERLGAAYGLHRTLDTAGAFAGPLVAFGLLALVPFAFGSIFITSFCFAVVGLAVLFLFVQNRAAGPEPSARSAPGLRQALRLLGAGAFRRLAIAGSALGLFTLSDGFLYVALQRHLQFSLTFFPLLYVGTSLFYLLLALPAGRLADRVGPPRLFIAAQPLLLAVYLVILLPTLGGVLLLAALLMFGAYYACTDGVLMAAASAVLPEALRASGIGLLTTLIAAGRLLSSLLFGLLWTWQGTATAVLFFAAGLVVATGLAGWLLGSRSRVSVEPAI